MVQPPTAGPRAALTEAQVVALIQDTPALTVGNGCELIDMALNVVEDISADFAGGSISRSSYATLHGSAELHMSRELDWAQALVRPYIILTDGTVTARFNLGAYYTNTPRIELGRTPVLFDVQGYDILHALNTPVGEAYAVGAGTAYLTAVEAILAEQGFIAYLIDQSSVAIVLPVARVWPLDERTTWLNVCNDLLASVGYQGIWSDWDGQLRCQPYQVPRDRPPEWVYTAHGDTAMVSVRRTVEHDFFDVPNRWVAVQSNRADGPAPAEGDGVYSYTNEYQGGTSVEARGGRIITRFLSLDAADQNSLVAQATAAIDADMRVPTKITLPTAPNPLHWHFDRLYLDDPDLGPPVEVLGTQWTLPLDGGNQSHEWSVL